MLIQEKIKKAIELYEKVGYVFLASASVGGLPHLACAKKMRLDTDGKVCVTEWFCPGTVENLNENPRVTVVIWDTVNDTGYQLVGVSQGVKEMEYLDGYVSELTSDVVKRGIIPEVEREITIKVNEVLEFKQAPHSDTEG